MFPSLDFCLKSGFLSSRKIISSQCCIQYQSVRNYPRKPRWIPMAKTKMYKIIDIPPPPKLEYQEVNAQYDTYRLYNRSLWDFQGNIYREKEIQQQTEARQVSEEVELERMFTINDTENAKVREIREASLVDEWKEVEREILEMKKHKEEEELAKLEVTEKFLESEMERFKGAIKLEDLDEVIEKALAVEVDYNFAIGKKGEIYRGRFNSTEGVDGPIPQDPILKPLEATK